MNNYLLGIVLLNLYFLLSYQQNTTVTIISTINYESIPYCDEISTIFYNTTTFRPSDILFSTINYESFPYCDEISTIFYNTTTFRPSNTIQSSTSSTTYIYTFINTSPTTTSSSITTSVSKKPSPTKIKRIFIFYLKFSLPKISKRQSTSFLSTLQLIVESSFNAELSQNVTVSVNISSSNTSSSSVDVKVERTFVEENIVSLNNFTVEKALEIMTSNRTFSQIITSSNTSGLLLETTQSNLRVTSIEIIENPDGSIVTTQCEPLSVSTISSSHNCTTKNTTLANTSTAITTQFTFSESFATQNSTSSLTNSIATISQSTTSESNLILSTIYQNTTTDSKSLPFSDSTGIFTTLPSNSIQTTFSNSPSMTSTNQNFKTTTITNENSETSTTIIVNTQETTIKLTTTKISENTTLLSSLSSKDLEITTSTTSKANPFTIQATTTTLPRDDLIEIVTLIEISGGLSLSLSISITGRQIQLGNVNLFLLDNAIQEIIKPEFSTGGKISTKVVSGETVIVIDINSTSNSNLELGPKLKNIIESIDTNRSALKSLVPSSVVLKIDSRKFEITANQTVFVGGSKTTMTSCSKILENEIKCIKQSFDKNGNLNSTINSTINVQITAENFASRTLNSNLLSSFLAFLSIIIFNAAF